MKKRIFCMALAVLMALALLPFAALAADRPAVAPYKPTLKSILSQSNGNADGLFVDLNGDDIPELLAAYEFYDGVRGAALYTIENGRAKWLLNADDLRGDLTFSSDDYASLDVVVRSGRPYVMACRTQSYPAGVDAQYGQTYWSSGEFWLYAFADAAVTQVDHWSYRLHELDDGRYFEGEGGVKHNGAPASVEELDAFWESLSFVCTVSLFDDTDGIPLELLLRATEGKFIDVEAEEYYAKPVDWAVAKGVTNGTGAFTFSPEDPCTRGQVVTFLWRAAGSPKPTSANHPFADITPNDYFYEAVLWAVEQGITNGMDERHFGPDVPCTRAHVVTFLWRAEGKPAAGASNPFADVPAGEYYTDAVLWAVKNGITNGMDARHFGPDSICIRGQIVTFLYRALADPTEPTPQPVGDLRMACSAEMLLSTEEFGRDLAYYISNHSGTNVDAVPVDGTIHHLAAMESGEAQLCLCRADMAAYAKSGTRSFFSFGAYEDFSVVAACYAEPIRIITVDASIQTVGDLRGKTVALGEKGSLIYYNALDILSAYGLTEADITPVYAAPADAVSAVKNGDCDTAFLPGSTALWSSTGLNDLSYTLVAMDEAHVDLLIAAKPYYTKAYDESGQLCSVSVPTLLLARNDVVEEDVQNILSVILDESVMAPMCVYSREAQQLLRPGFAGGFTALPYHPGAIAYFSEH